MSDELINENVAPAKLSDGEALIPESVNTEIVDLLVEQYKDAVSAQQEKLEKVEEAQALAPLESGAIGVSKVAKTPKQEKPKQSKKLEDVNKVAVHSTKNVTWNGVGKVYRGYNIVTAEQAEKWATRDHIRIATPQEVAREFGL